MAINALTISGPIAGEHAIIVQDFRDGMVQVHQGNKSVTLPKEMTDAYAENVTGLVAFVKAMLAGETPESEETDKERADRLAAALQRIADQSREHFATSIAMEALQGWDARTE